MELSATARVILGMLAVEPHSGYEIKALADKTTRFFWAASYGQIYPELKRLAAAGLVEAEDSPQGGRRRTTYRLTEGGRGAFRDWIAAPEQTHEMRDEGLLKLFFAGAADPAAALPALKAKRDRHLETVARLREIEPLAATNERFGPLAVLNFGLELHEFAAEWCERTIGELEGERKTKRKAKR